MSSHRAAPDGEGPEATFQRARDSALRFLAYRPRSEAEVRRRLSRRYSPEVVQRVIDALGKQGYLDDQAFAQQWRSNREQHQPRSGRLVRQELRRLGVPSEVVQEALTGFDEGGNAYRAGLKVVQKLRGRNYSGEELERRLWSNLRRRGFAYAETRRVVERLLTELGPDLLHCEDNAQDDEHQSEEAQEAKANWPRH